MNMKQYVLLLFLLVSLGVNAQDQPKFSPEKFEAELESFITREAGLDQQEAAKFFPILKEMHQKQRSLYARMRKTSMEKPADEKGCAESIRQRDQIDLELKQIQQTYHNKFLRVIPASKLWEVLQAEDRFFRMKLRSWGGGMQPNMVNGNNQFNRPNGNNNRFNPNGNNNRFGRQNNNRQR